MPLAKKSTGSAYSAPIKNASPRWCRTAAPEASMSFLFSAPTSSGRGSGTRSQRSQATAPGEVGEAAVAALGGEVVAAEAAEEPDEEQDSERPEKAAEEDAVTVLVVGGEDLRTLAALGVGRDEDHAGQPERHRERAGERRETFPLRGHARTPFCRIGTRIDSALRPEVKRCDFGTKSSHIGDGLCAPMDAWASVG